MFVHCPHSEQDMGVERQGIGTPATRAATIEKLVQKGFLERKGTKKTKVLLPTDICSCDTKSLNSTVWQ